ncbi:xanthine dehydrogenase family protein molybdopterin-binding subunit [Schnuerera ultunensis]|uniref:Aerobic-type carbon monoxide dehydrogenase, large subunit CoxL/CutL-like protein n=1 Tax=[Clostridium] ultunense Esp TaxID=1288971 RepID=A0A1M4PLQ3_9FIRM|nr:molybdopterin cofactor-binding domain-containing protein [Schnuerera ultunensis]SHD76380.1 Aerobic-type carbon monoxide dehydrogenase, large subunit CoxL/CutL-like protein [[Clostridium] ultunense Esp]
MMTEGNYKYIGKSVPRHDAIEKATGKIKYVGDMKVNGMLYARLVLSHVAHGKIKSIDISKAKDLPGVVDIFTYDNSPKILYNAHKWMSGMDEVLDQYLFTDKVRFYGDRVAAVVATNDKIAKMAADLIEVEYEVLPAIIDPETSLIEDSIKIHERGNIAFSKTMGYGDVDKVFDKASYIFEDKIITPKQHHAAMETHVALAIPSGDMITIYTPCQVVFQVQLIVSEALNIPLSKVRVIKAPMGGSFGGKGQPIIEPVCAFLAKETGRPVRLTLDRTQSIIGTRTRHKTIGTVKTAVDKKGKILGRDLDIVIDSGAYHTNASAIAMAMGKKFFRMYKMDNVRYSATSVYTNTPVGGACRGYGSPQLHAITELNLDNVARGINMDPVEFRLKNLVHPFDKDPMGGPDLGNGQIIECVKRGAEAFGWKEKWKRPKDSGRYRKGVGMACGTHGNGYYGAYPDFITMDIKMNSNGEVILNSAIHDMGCGTVTIMQQIVAEVLDLELSKITVLEGDTLSSPYDSAGTQASRVTYVCGGAAKKISEILKDKFAKYSSKILNCYEEDIVMEGGYIYNKNKPDKKVGYGDMVSNIYHQYSMDMSASYTYSSPANPGVYAANFVEVEVDTYTGLVNVLDIVAVHDIGRAINRDFVYGQVQGGIHLGLGMAISENIELDENGRISTLNFSNYHVINAPSMPDVRIILIEEEDEFGPFGAKSVGEISAVAIAPATLNAINNAIGTNISQYPATPERIVEALVKTKK